MKFLDRLVRAALACCMLALSSYIIVKSVEIAAENGMFDNAPVLSAIYERVTAWTAEACLPVLSYIDSKTGEDEAILDVLAGEAFPIYAYARRQPRQKPASESSEEYELILKAQGAAEENRQPRETESAAEAEQPETEARETEQPETKARETEQPETEARETDQPETEARETDRPETEMPETALPDRETQSAEAQPTEALSYQELLYGYFSVDVNTTIDEERLDAEKLLSMDMTMEKDPETPQILIYHTHSQEAFADSVEGDASTTIVGIGEYLTQLLREQYGYNVIHETGVFDLVDGVLDRSAAYDYSEAAVTALLEKYPSIQVVIDLHRDGVDGQKMVTSWNGKDTARLMFIAGMSRTADGADITYLPNPYIQENLAFALQLTRAAEQSMPGLMRNIYLMAYRFNLHLRPQSLLVEAGTQLSTVQEEKNAMEALAELLDSVLSGEK